MWCLIFMQFTGCDQGCQKQYEAVGAAINGGHFIIMRLVKIVLTKLLMCVFRPWVKYSPQCKFIWIARPFWSALLVKRATSFPRAVPALLCCHRTIWSTGGSWLLWGQWLWCPWLWPASSAFSFAWKFKILTGWDIMVIRCVMRCASIDTKISIN